MFYRSFFYECLVNLYFKKKYFLEGLERQKYSFKNTQTHLVKSITKDDLKNLYLSDIPIRLSTKFKNYFLKRLNKIYIDSRIKIRGN